MNDNDNTSTTTESQATKGDDAFHAQVGEWLVLRDQVKDIKKQNSERLKPVSEREKAIKEVIIEEAANLGRKNIVINGKVIQLVRKVSPVKLKEEDIVFKLKHALNNNEKAAKKVYRKIYEENRETKSTTTLRVKPDGSSDKEGGGSSKKRKRSSEEEENPFANQEEDL